MAEERAEPFADLAFQHVARAGRDRSEWRGTVVDVQRPQRSSPIVPSTSATSSSTATGSVTSNPDA